MAIDDLQILKTPIMSKKIPTLEIPNVGTPTLPNPSDAWSYLALEEASRRNDLLPMPAL